MARVMKTFLEPQRHGTSKEVQKLSCILKLKSVIYTHRILRIHYTLQTTHIDYHQISISTMFRQHNQLHHVFRNRFTFYLSNLWVKHSPVLCTMMHNTSKLKPYTYLVHSGTQLGIHVSTVWEHTNL